MPTGRDDNRLKVFPQCFKKKPPSPIGIGGELGIIFEGLPGSETLGSPPPPKYRECGSGLGIGLENWRREAGYPRCSRSPLASHSFESWSSLRANSSKGSSKESVISVVRGISSPFRRPR